MNLTIGSVLGAFIGLATSYGVSLLILTGLAQTLVGVLASVLLGEWLVWFVFLQFSEVGKGFFGFGLENLVWLTAVLTVAAVIHSALAAVAPIAPWVNEHRALLIGAAAAAYTGVQVARAVDMLVELNVADPSQPRL